MGKFCTKCGTPLQEGSDFCGNCGQKTQEENQEMNSLTHENEQPVKHYSDTSMLNNKQKKKKMGCLPIFVIFLAIMSVGFVLALGTDGAVTGKSKISEAMGMSEAEAQKVSEILDICKVGTVKSITYDENLDISDSENEKGYRLENNLSANIALYINPDNTVNAIRYADRDFYKNGEQLLSFEDFVITDSEKSDCQISAQNAVESILNSPSTAKFPNILEWNIWKEDGIYIIQSYVDSQNGFGATVRSEFQMKVKDEQVISFIFDGQELISS